ncbi:choice-of-anchor M domain-containing protein [Polymorphospora lycopeni]|uniref:Choice-of-anchor M domain-containing protein n=1 Tax=Polymorphospora lycopeni TaxID=3140240 RepID=A0ABV5D680_9ACTN
MTDTTRTRTLASLIAGGVLVAGTLLAAQPAAAAERVVLSRGHVDAVDVHYTGGQLQLKVHDGTVEPSVERDPADVTFQVAPGAATTVPDDPRYAFLGTPGADVWVLPQTQDPDLLWPGWNTTELGTGVFAGNQVRLSLVDVAGPGAVTLFGVNAFGDPLVRFRSSDGLPDAIDVPVGTHAHASWAFTALGEYTLKFRADATLADGTALTTGPVDYSFVVGDLTGGGTENGLTIGGLADSYQPNDTVTLRAVQTPPSELDHYHWFSRCPGATDFAIIPGEAGETYRFTATRELDACEYVVKLYGPGHGVVATSPPVTLRVADQPQQPGAAQTITASIDATQGALVVSVDPDDRSVVLPTARLNAAGDRWESQGELRPVKVTDTRSAAPGWSVSGQIPADFAGPDGTTFGAGHLGWTPRVVSQGSGQGAVAGPEVAPYATGTGLGASSVLATAPGGAGRGTAELSAGLRLSVPTETPPGTYTATLTLTAI